MSIQRRIQKKVARRAKSKGRAPWHVATSRAAKISVFLAQKSRAFLPPVAGATFLTGGAMALLAPPGGFATGILVFNWLNLTIPRDQELWSSPDEMLDDTSWIFSCSKMSEIKQDSNDMSLNCKPECQSSWVSLDFPIWFKTLNNWCGVSYSCYSRWSGNAFILNR